ncbi:MAG: hypothetical protein WC700_02040 [Gemmatimonadaceae bacterium]|jgi:hypothetical protein
MSDISLFSSDELLTGEQGHVRRHNERPLSEAEKALVAIADARELRLHRRLRAFAWWVFILPAWLWLLGVVTAVLGRFLLS